MATKRSSCCCIPFSYFSSSSSDEEEQEHPTSGAGARSSPSATHNTIETLPGAQAPIPGSSNVVTPVSESLRKSEGKNVNVNLNVPEAPQCNEASSSGSSNVPDRSDREDVNANLNVSRATQCDEAPSSGSPNVPGKSEGEGVDADLNVSGAPLSNEAPSSSSPSFSSTSTSRVATKSDVIDTIKHKGIVQTDGKNVAVNYLDDLTKHISELLKRREEEMRGKKVPNPGSNFSWPNFPGFKKLNAILSLDTDLKNLKELLSSGLEFVSELKDIISGPVKELLKDIGQASVFTAGLLVVANTLERFHDLSTNKEKCWDLIKEMSYFAIIVKRFTESPRGTQADVIQDAVTLIVEGAILCCTHIDRSAWKSFFRASKDKDDLSDMRQKLDVKYKQIDIEIGLRLSTDIEGGFAAIAARNSPLSKEYPEHAVGIEESIEEVKELLECDNEKNVVIVILHGFGGIGKTTLADAVFSKVEGCKYSKVQLFKDIDSKPDIVKLQEDILKDLMEPQESVQIRKYEDGQKELGKILKKRQAFIYIDNVLDQVELEHLLPEDLHEAKKVRFLLTARDKNAKLAFPSSVSTQIYDMKGIKNRQAARSILEKETLEGLDSRKVDQIIKKCDGLPLLLKLVARFIGHAGDKGAAYDKLMQEEEIWNNEKFKEMSLRLAYDALPEKCKDPFLDICSYFRRWDWDTVENIVGKNELEMLENRALVTKDTFTGVVNVHDVILELGMSKGKELRLTFSSARELMASLEEKTEGAEGIKGIWLSGNNDTLWISATTLDSMHKSLRVLQLGNLTEVEGKCSKIFEELVFFEAKVPQLPFHDMSKLKQLKYLSYAPNELKLSKMPSSLRHMEFDGSSDSHAFQISSQDLEDHRDLRILRLINFSKLTNLSKELGDQVTSLQELSLSNCKSIEKLPDSIAKLRSLRILKMDNCSNLTELLVDFGSLSSLQELNLARCIKLKALPDSIDKLSSLKVLNLSNCKKLLNLPSELGKLTCLVELNIDSCESLDNIPENIGELKQLRVMDMRWCGNLKELPDGFCNLSSITHLSFPGCESLEKLPDRFGQLKSLKVLDMRRYRTLEKLPEGFGQLKNLERLDLEDCSQLRELCNDFHCLSSLQQLDLTGCESLEKLPEDFHCLSSLQKLDLSYCESLEKLPEDFHCLSSLQQLYLTGCTSLEKLPEDFHFLTSLQMVELEKCPKLEGKSMDHLTKMNTLQLVSIIGSDELLQRWGEIQRDCQGSSYPTVIISEEASISENNKENMKNSVLSELDCLLTNGRGEALHLSHLLPNTSALLIFDSDKDRFPWPLIEETVDDGMQIKLIYIGPHFDQLPTKVKYTIFVVHTSEKHLLDIWMNMMLTAEGEVQGAGRYYLQMDAKMVGDGNSDNYAPCFCWRFLRDGEVEEFVVCNSGRYLRLKQLQAETDEESSNIEMLRELFAPDGDETTPVFQKNESSQKDPTENSERKTTCGVDKLEGKTILVEMWPSKSWTCEINHPLWKEMYFMEKEKVDLEIISIPIVHPKHCDVIDVYKQFSRQVPWLVLQNSWTVITRAVELFFEKHCGWEKPHECEKWYPTMNWIIDPNGRISVYRPSIFLKDMRDRGELFEVDKYDVFINHRGEVKKNFASHLHRALHLRGLRPFLDQKDLLEGESFPSQLEDVIKNASVHVAVFSPKYAESHWCLHELLLMRESGAPIIPVFYHINPADLRWTAHNKTKGYGLSLHQLELKTTLDPRTQEEKPRYDPATIHKWRDALSFVADINGFDLDGKFNGDEVHMIDKIVERLGIIIRKPGLHVATHPTGLEDYIFLKEEWEQPKNMSTLEFLFNHSESVSAQVQKLMLPGKLICLYRGGDDNEQVMYSMWNALEQQQRDRVHIIHLGCRSMESFEFTDSMKKDYYYPLKNTAEIEGMSLLNLSENEIVRFSLRLCHLEEEINRMEDSELKFLLHYFQPLHSFQDEDGEMYGSIAFMDWGGKVVAALGGSDLESIFCRRNPSGAQRFMKSIMNDIERGGKEMPDEDPGVFDRLIQNLQTASTSVLVEQKNMDAYFKSLREYISERREVEFYQAFIFNKEEKKRSLPSATWPTSRGFCRLKNFLSEGISDDWVKDIISRHPEEEDQREIVIHGLLKDIEEAQWAVAGVLAVAYVFDRFETISVNEMEYLFRVALYVNQINQQPGLWRRVKRVATAIIVAYSFHGCSHIDESKFALFSDHWNYAEWRIRDICEQMAKAITEGPSNECGLLLWDMCHHSCFNRGFFLRSGDEGGPSCEGESDVSAVEAGSTATDEGGPSCGGESDVSDVSTASTGEEE